MKTAAPTPIASVRRRERRHHRGGFTLGELMMSLAIGSVVCATTMTGVVFLQKSYAATEQYATSMADQMRVLDYLALDMRRASTVKIDSDTLALTLPGYFTYDKTDAAHRNPLPAWPSVDASSVRAVYNAGSAVPTVTYRFDKASGQLQRQEAYSDGTVSTWQIVASQVSAFPNITIDALDPRKYTVSLSFRPTFETYDTPDSNLITLATVVYLRNP